MKLKRTLRISGLVVLALVTVSLIGLYRNKSHDDLNRSVEQEVARRYRLWKFLKGVKFTFKSSGLKKIRFQCYAGQHSDGTTCELNKGQGKHTFGVAEKDALRPSTHVFDFVDMTVTQKAYVDGFSRKTTYIISDYSRQFTPFSTTHILKIASSGMKEIRINPNELTIAYHYENGKVLVFKELTREFSFELLEQNSKI